MVLDLDWPALIGSAIRILPSDNIRKIRNNTFSSFFISKNGFNVWETSLVLVLCSEIIGWPIPSIEVVLLLFEFGDGALQCSA